MSKINDDDDIVDRLEYFARVGAGVALLIAAAVEIKRLRERLGPRGLEVVEIDGTGHYVNEKVKAEIGRLRRALAVSNEAMSLVHDTPDN